MINIVLVLGLLALSACGELQPGTPGHEPPTGGNYNPVSGTRSNGR